jgi:hypothetical protein
MATKAKTTARKIERHAAAWLCFPCALFGVEHPDDQGGHACADPKPHTDEFGTRWPARNCRRGPHITAKG